MGARVFKSTSPGGLDQELLPMRLWHRAKKIGVWDPMDIDFTTDRADWRRLGDEERDVLLRLTSLFEAGAVVR